jgi:hypothetical protein
VVSGALAGVKKRLGDYSFWDHVAFCGCARYLHTSTALSTIKVPDLTKVDSLGTVAPASSVRPFGRHVDAALTITRNCFGEIARRVDDCVVLEANFDFIGR